jgi:hypothetical protein
LAASVKAARPLAAAQGGDGRGLGGGQVARRAASAGLIAAFSAGEAVATAAADDTSSPSLRDRA